MGPFHNGVTQGNCKYLPWLSPPPRRRARVLQALHHLIARGPVPLGGEAAV